VCHASAVAPSGDSYAPFVHAACSCPIYQAVLYGLEQFDVVTVECVS